MSEPFPRLVRYALMGPFGVFAAAYVLALLGKGGQESKILNSILLIATAGAALVELLAVPTAIILLVRDAPRYTSVANIVLTLLAALPIVLVSLVVLLFSGALGTFHI